MSDENYKQWQDEVNDMVKALLGDSEQFKAVLNAIEGIAHLEPLFSPRGQEFLDDCQEHVTMLDPLADQLPRQALMVRCMAAGVCAAGGFFGNSGEDMEKEGLMPALSHSVAAALCARMGMELMGVATKMEILPPPE